MSGRGKGGGAADAADVLFRTCETSLRFTCFFIRATRSPPPRKHFPGVLCFCPCTISSLAYFQKFAVLNLINTQLKKQEFFGALANRTLHTCPVRCLLVVEVAKVKFNRHSTKIAPNFPRNRNPTNPVACNPINDQISSLPAEGAKKSHPLNPRTRNRHTLAPPPPRSQSKTELHGAHSESETRSAESSDPRSSRRTTPARVSPPPNELISARCALHPVFVEDGVCGVIGVVVLKRLIPIGVSR